MAPPAPPALPPAPVLSAPLPREYHPGPYRDTRRSLADMANEQLRRKPKDPLAEGMKEAGREDCLRPPEKPGLLGGLLNAPVAVARALNDACPK